MQYKIYSIPVPSKSGQEEGLNAFLRSHKVLSVKEYLIQNKEQNFLLFSIEYIATSSDVASDKKNRVDYKEILSEGDYQLFNKLRGLRKQLADEAGLPVYTVFTNEQLAAMLKNKVADEAGLRAIDGIGEAKIEKYAKPFLAFLAEEKTGTASK